MSGRLALALALSLGPAVWAADAVAVARPTSPDARAVAWMRDSLEYAAVSTEVYRSGLRYVRQFAKKHPGLRNWCVILDIDDTVLTTVPFRAEEAGRPFEWCRWEKWVQGHYFKPVPGAKEFLDGVRRLPGAHVVFLTDRRPVILERTRANLERDGLWGKGDLLIGQDSPADTKQKRRRDCVERAIDPRCKAAGPMTIAALFGDQVLDFKFLRGNDVAKARSEIIRNGGWDPRYFVLPNPTYGAWTRGYAAKKWRAQGWGTCP